jgi:hypothetical protein
MEDKRQWKPVFLKLKSAVKVYNTTHIIARFKKNNILSALKTLYLAHYTTDVAVVSSEVVGLASGSYVHTMTGTNATAIKAYNTTSSLRSTFL